LFFIAQKDLSLLPEFVIFLNRKNIKMVKNLFLIRHAEAFPQAKGQRDFDRELTPTGFGDAARLGKLLLDNKVIPDLVISSPAQRAISTAETILTQLNYNISNIEVNEEVYEASVRTLFNIIKEVSAKINNLVVVGHNPTLTYIAEYLAKKVIGNISPSGMVELNFEIENWEEIGEGKARSFQYFSPLSEKQANDEGE
jgi:phosphohistidine phosphatase